MTQPLRELFAGLDLRVKGILADQGSPLRLLELTLFLAEEHGNLEHLSLDDVVEALEAADVAVDRKSLARAIPRAGRRISRKVMDGERKYSLMTSGRRDVESMFQLGDLEMLFIEGDRPRTARRQVGDLLSAMRGVVRICDPYYGIRTLELLEMIPETSSVRFLTARTGESATKLSGPLGDFKKERSNVELRVASAPSELHDRYVLAEETLLLIGHGLKDLGGKESFVIALSTDLVPDLVANTTAAFDRRWNAASPL